MATSDEYVERGRQGILDLLSEHHALVWPEVEARLAETFRGYDHIDPHHLETARKELAVAGLLVHRPHRTRGGRAIPILRLSAPGPRRAVEAATARKALLYARYLGWASGTKTKQGITGPAMERALHASITEAAPHVGYRIENPRGGQTRHLAGLELPPPYGPLDNGASYVDWNSAMRTGLAVEAKNIRDWIYPWSQDLYQLLVKACVLQRAANDVSILPVLLCRRAHPTTFKMARDLGFHVISTRRQYILPSYFQSEDDEKHLNEVRTELSFYDLFPDDGPDIRVVNQFRTTIPARIALASTRWANHGSTLEVHYRVLRDGTNRRDRRTALAVIRNLTQALQQQEPDIGMGW